MQTNPAQLDPVVATKIRFVSDYAVLLAEIDAEGLPKELGGKRELAYPCECAKELL